MSEPQYVAETLAWCNARRGEQGRKALKRLPKGERGNGYSCPCGKATKLWVGGASFGIFAHASHERLPGSVQDFVAAFDHGELPQYEAVIR